MEFVELNMKKKYSTLPESMKNMEMYGFNWMEFVISVPSLNFLRKGALRMPQIFRMGEYWIYFWTNENKPVIVNFH